MNAVMMNVNPNKKTEQPEKVLQQRLHRLRRKKNQFRLICSLTATALLTYFSFGVVFGIGFVRGQSMNPAFQDGDLVIFWRLSKNYGYGDVLLLKNDMEKELIKRVAAVPGDKVDVDTQGRLMVNEQSVWDVYTKPGTEYPITLLENEYFVLGDNWQVSLDSRNFGPAEKSSIHGKVILVLRSQINIMLFSKKGENCVS